MTRSLSERTGRLGTETAFEVLARARALEARGRDIVHLEIGEPDFDTPAHVVEAGRRALSEGWTHYGPAAGLPELRQAIAEDAGARRGLAFDPEQVLVCPGAKPVMFYVILSLIDVGDEVIYPNPGFPIYESMIRYVGGTAVPLPLMEERGFAFSADDVRSLVTDRTKLLILNTPGNPTGGFLDGRLLEAVARIAVERDLWVLSDEIYMRLLYEGEHVSIATFPGMAERTIILDGFSKIFAMTGWRLGYAIGPPPLMPHLARLQVNSVSCTASFTQVAGVEALRGPQDEPARMLETFRKRRDLIVEGLNALPGVSCVTPKGAFYAFPNIKATGRRSKELSDLLLEEAGVAVLPGTSFGAYGEGYLRLSYANSMENIEKALERMRDLLSNLA